MLKIGLFSVGILSISAAARFVGGPQREEVPLEPPSVVQNQDILRGGPSFADLSQNHDTSAPYELTK